MHMTERLVVTVDIPLKKKAMIKAQANGTTISYVVRKSLEDYIKNEKKNVEKKSRSTKNLS